MDLQTIPFDLYKPQYPFWCLNFFFITWCLGSLFHYLLSKTKTWDISTKFLALTEEKRRNVVIYVLQILLTTIALIAQVVGGIDVFFQMKETTSELRMDLMVLSTEIVFVLYLWELIYRLGIGFPLLVHHIMTCLIGQLFAASFFDTFDVIYIRLALVMLLYATTEQSSFVALFCYRLDLLSKKSQVHLFTLAAVQSFVVKSAIAIFALVYFCIAFFVNGAADDQPTNWKWFWKICFIPLLLLLFAAQIFSSNILWQLRNKCLKEQTGGPEMEKSGTVGSPSSVLIDSSSNHTNHVTADIDTVGFNNNSIDV